MIICDRCGDAKDCLQKEIEGKEYDICSECWNPFAQKLRGKGRVKSRETVFLPPPRVVKERENEEPEASVQVRYFKAVDNRVFHPSQSLHVTYSHFAAHP